MYRLLYRPVSTPVSAPLSSSLIRDLNFNTTTTRNEMDALPPEWREVDYLPLNDVDCPFGPKQLRQARSYGMSPEALQECIYNFAWALSKKWQPPGGFQTSPLNFFMGCLKTTGVYEHDGYYRQRQMRREKEQGWLNSRRHQQKDETGDGESEVCQQGSDILDNHERSLW